MKQVFAVITIILAGLLSLILIEWNPIFENGGITERVVLLIFAVIAYLLYKRNFVKADKVSNNLQDCNISIRGDGVVDIDGCQQTRPLAYLSLFTLEILIS